MIARLILLAAMMAITGCAIKPGSAHIEAAARHGMAARAKVVSAIKKAEKLKRDVPEANKAAVADLEQDVREANAQLEFALPELKKVNDEMIGLRSEVSELKIEREQLEGKLRPLNKFKDAMLVAFFGVGFGFSWKFLGEFDFKAIPLIGNWLAGYAKLAQIIGALAAGTALAWGVYYTITNLL